MTFSSLSGKNNSPDSLLSQRLEKIGVQEISLWKEMVLKDEPLFNEINNLLSPSEAIAVRANALQLLLNISLIEPELQSELISVTESILEEELTSGMNSKAKSILRTLKRQ